MVKGFLEIEISDLTDMVGYMQSIMEASLEAAGNVSGPKADEYNDEIKKAFEQFKTVVQAVSKKAQKEDLCQCPKCRKRRLRIN